MEFIEQNVQIFSFLLTFVLTAILGPILIPFLRTLKFGQTIRDDGPQSHLKKTGTPTIGGLIFFIPIFIVAIFLSFKYSEIIPITLATFGYAFIGFLDDFIKVKKKRKDGLYANQKSVLQIIVSAGFAFYAYYFTSAGQDIIIPFIDFQVPAWLFILFTIFFMYGMTNAVNLSDGLDGLCGGLTFVVALFFSVIVISQTSYIHLSLFSALLAGGCLGFLIFNIHPAKVFMGDTGSLALGGALAGIAILMKMPFILLLVGAIYVLEAFSVMIQVGYFKISGGKRVFKMAPIHHHFELSGWKETKVVKVFISITVVLAIVGLFVVKTFY